MGLLLFALFGVAFPNRSGRAGENDENVFRPKSFGLQ